MDDAALPGFQVSTSDSSATKGLLRTEQVILKQGPRVLRNAMVRHFGDASTGVVSRRDLTLGSWVVRQRSDGEREFTENERRRWSCQDEEITALQAFLAAELPDAGSYRLTPADAAGGGADPATAGLLRRLANLVSASAADVGAVADMDEAVMVSTILRRARHQHILDEVRRVVVDPASTEPDIQKVLGEQYWMFGGRYIGLARRSLTTLDQIDIPLLRPDGSLHIVELKRANVSDLVVKHRNHYIVGPGVNTAVGQVMNYLVALDEQRPQIRLDFGVETRRASGTVVIGSPEFVQGGLSREIVDDTLRTYSAGLARIEVITFADLLDGAHRSLLPDDNDTGSHR